MIKMCQNFFSCDFISALIYSHPQNSAGINQISLLITNTMLTYWKAFQLHSTIFSQANDVWHGMQPQCFINDTLPFNYLNNNNKSVLKVLISLLTSNSRNVSTKNIRTKLILLFMYM